MRPSELADRSFERGGSSRDRGCGGCGDEKQVDVFGLALDQALHDEGGATGDRESGALGKAEEQLRGFYLKRCEQAWRHLCGRASANSVDERLPCASQ